MFGIPEDSYKIRESASPENANFMTVKVVDQSNLALRLISENGVISAAKMGEVVRTALKRALAQVNHRVMINRQVVRISLSDKGLALTLTPKPENSITIAANFFKGAPWRKKGANKGAKKGHFSEKRAKKGLPYIQTSMNYYIFIFFPFTSALHLFTKNVPYFSRGDKRQSQNLLSSLSVRFR